MTAEAAPTLPSGARGAPRRAVRRAHGAPEEGPGWRRVGDRSFEPGLSRAACGARRVPQEAGGGGGARRRHRLRRVAGPAGNGHRGPGGPPAEQPRDKLPRQRGRGPAPPAAAAGAAGAASRASTVRGPQRQNNRRRWPSTTQTARQPAARRRPQSRAAFQAAPTASTNQRSRHGRQALRAGASGSCSPWEWGRQCACAVGAVGGALPRGRKMGPGLSDPVCVMAGLGQKKGSLPWGLTSSGRDAQTTRTPVCLRKGTERNAGVVKQSPVRILAEYPCVLFRCFLASSSPHVSSHTQQCLVFFSQFVQYANLLLIFLIYLLSVLGKNLHANKPAFFLNHFFKEMDFLYLKKKN